MVSIHFILCRPCYKPYLGKETSSVETLSCVRKMCLKKRPVRCFPPFVGPSNLPDSHCPWVWNCGPFSCQPEFAIADYPLTVGANNHRQFLLFVTTLVIGIALFDYLSYECEAQIQRRMSPC